MEMKVVYCKIGEGRCLRIEIPENNRTCEVEELERIFRLECEDDESLTTMIKNKQIIFQFEDKPGIFCDIGKRFKIPACSTVKCVFISQGPPIIEQSEKTNGISSPGQTNTSVKPLVLKSTKPVKQTLSLKPNRTISYPTKLPILTEECKLIIKNKLMYDNQSPFIDLWGADLFAKTSGIPNPTDYANYAKTIVRTYPILGGGADGNDHRIVSQQLSGWIRRWRKKLKKLAGGNNDEASKRPRSEDSDEENNDNPGPSKRFKLARDKKTVSVSKSVESAVQALKEKTVVEDNDNIRSLLRKTSNYRKKWLSNQKEKEIKDVVAEFPHTKNAALILYDLAILKNVSETEMNEAGDELIQDLGKVSRKPVETEKEKAEMIEKTYADLVGLKIYKTLNEHLITIEEAGAPVYFETSAKAAPRLVLHTYEGELASAYIVAGGGMKVKVFNPTTSKALVALVAAYYAWDVNYPKAYQKTLDFLDFKLCGTRLPCKSNVKNFVRDLKYNLDELAKEDTCNSDDSKVSD